MFDDIDRGIAAREKLAELSGELRGLDFKIHDICLRLVRTSGSGDIKLGRRWRKLDLASRRDREWLLSTLVRAVQKRERFKVERIRVRGLVQRHRDAMHEELRDALSDRMPEPEGTA